MRDKTSGRIIAEGETKNWYWKKGYHKYGQEYVRSEIFPRFNWLLTCLRILFVRTLAVFSLPALMLLQEKGIIVRVRAQVNKSPKSNFAVFVT
jgi:hypothetical protein